MTRWARATHVMLCGRCVGRIIRPGEPVWLITMPAITRQLVRCVDCSGPAPPDLPALVERQAPVTASMMGVSEVRPKTRGELKQIAREWLPYRESGEEG